MATFDGTKPPYEGSLVSADIRDNFNALKDNKIVYASQAVTVDDGAISQAKLKTSSGSVSVEGGLSANKILPGGEYGFYPQLTQNEGPGDYVVSVQIATEAGPSYETKIYLDASGMATNNYLYARQRYVTASGEVYWIFIARAKSDGRILATWQAPDHPCFGNGGDPDLIPHPFNSIFDKDGNSIDFEVLVINPSIEFMKDINDKTPKSNDLLETLFAENDVDDSIEPVWPGKEVTVDFKDDSFPFNEKEKAQVKKQIVPKPKNVRTATFKAKAIK